MAKEKMPREKVEEAVEKMAIPAAERFGAEVEDVEYVKEGSEFYLRVYIDKEGKVTIDDCENVSRALSDELDKNDPTGEPYILEVSSPGLTRRLYKEKHFIKYTGYDVDVKLFKELDGKKTLTGKLLEYKDSAVTILSEGKEYNFNIKDAAKIALHVEI